jgi:hypothetical protein
MLGVTTKAHYKHSGEDIEVPYIGTIKARDDLVDSDVRKFVVGTTKYSKLPHY